MQSGTPFTADPASQEFLASLQQLAPPPNALSGSSSPPPDIWEAAHTEASAMQVAWETTREKALEYFELDSEVHSGADVEWGHIGHHVMEEAAEHVAEHAAHHAKEHVADKSHSAPPPLPKKQVQWHYTTDDETTLGPVPEAELLKLLRDGAVPMSALVWNKDLTDWMPASETPLAAKLEAAPPPLPKTRKRAPSVCGACGRAVTADDKFCPDCGKPLNP